MHIATATAIGSAHVNPGQPGKTNNQDALIVRNHRRGIVAVICDGCSLQPHSGTGADIGTHIIMNAICDQLGSSNRTVIDWKQLTDDVVSELRQVVGVFAGNSTAITAFETAVVQRFLFTALALVIVDNVATIAAFGDGVIVIDDEVIILESPIQNSPPYLGYTLMQKTDYHGDLSKHLMFSVVRTVNVDDLKKGIIVGSDGFGDLLNEDIHHPALVQPKSLQRWLNLLTTEQLKLGLLVPGKCRDDVSVVMVRSEKAQKALIEERREFVELKKSLEHLQNEVTRATQQAESAVSHRRTAEWKITELESQLRLLYEKAQKLEKYEAQIRLLRPKIELLRRQPKVAANSLMKILGNVLELLSPQQSPANITVIKVETGPTSGSQINPQSGISQPPVAGKND